MRNILDETPFTKKIQHLQRYWIELNVRSVYEGTLRVFMGIVAVILTTEYNQIRLCTYLLGVVARSKQPPGQFSIYDGDNADEVNWPMTNLITRVGIDQWNTYTTSYPESTDQTFKLQVSMIRAVCPRIYLGLRNIDVFLPTPNKVY